jgi:transcription-repair coupling factor (superfamily II helicase)
VPVSSALTLRALLKSAVARMGTGFAAGHVTGLSAAAKALLIAATAAREPGAAGHHAGLLVVVPSDADVEQMTGDARFFLGALEGDVATAVERAILPFPSPEIDPYRGLRTHLQVASARARALHSAASGEARIVVASAAALLPRVSAPERLLGVSADLRPGGEIDPHALAELLVDAGFTREDPVDGHGEFCVRGGVVDLFPAGDQQPVRIELVGDYIESIRRYDPATQRSVGAVEHARVVPIREVINGDGDRPSSVFDYVGGSVVFVSEPAEVAAQIDRHIEHAAGSYQDAVARGQAVPPPQALLIDHADLDPVLGRAIRLDELDVEEGDGAPGRHVACQPAVEYRGRVAEWVAEISRARERADTVVFVAATGGRADRTIELLADYAVPATPVFAEARAAGSLVIDAAVDQVRPVLVTTGALSRGFRLPDAGLQLFAEADVFEEERRAPERRRSLAHAFLSDFRDLKVDDLVVHVDHGIGVFVGLRQIAVGPQSDATQEFLELRYAGDDKLFVPVERLDLIQKYTGASRPPLDRLGGTSWERAKTRVRRAMRDMAGELLKLYASRKAIAGHAFSPDTHWQREFEGAFEYELTPDQQAAIADIKRDMEAPSPMDRLLCGDVGYGKTEVAMRAAFKAVMDGKQVAILAPTTVLAFQHLKTLTERFAAFPVRIDMVSRFRSRAEQKQVLEALAAGRIDIIVGTHRLLSKDVLFRDLGLLVVDEEQRFGVVHKERIKQLRRRVDVLTMTATPIPRTLNMSLVGIRDMSIIETPPKDRLSIQTNVVKFDQAVITRAIRSELARAGQVYFVHNRVESIFSIGNLVTRLVPEARIAIAHGQMGEDALERAMVDFIARKYDVLVATTIVENGLDIPNVNTIIINRADRYGLSQLYQLRGRVGRSDRPAYAYLMVPPGEDLTPVAKKRLAAIREFSDLGSGFRVAALDLEIRGAGNLLGGEQSGQIEAVGFEMYMKLLEQTVRELKGEELEDEIRAAVSLGVDLRIDEAYVPDTNQRLTFYRRVAASRTMGDLDQVLEEVRDRFGPLPDSVLNLADYGRIRIMADQLALESVDRQGPVVVFKFRDAGSTSRQARLADPEHLVRVLRARPDVMLTPPASVRLDLRKAGSAPPIKPIKSWWTARARAGEVRPGFSKEEILRPAPEDPRAPGGVLQRVGDLLSTMLGEG